MARDYSRFINEVEPLLFHFADDGDIPNNPRLPLVYYPGVIVEEDRDHARIYQEIFAVNDWPDNWRDGVYPFPHYHSDAHEVLGCYGGSAKIRLGGAGGIIRLVSAGDVVVVPAGVGHENMGASAGFKVVGSYPNGQSPDLCRGGQRPAGVAATIGQVPLPKLDPIYGGGSGLTTIWA